VIYFIKDTGSLAIKIGYSKKPNKRLSGLQTANPHKLLLLGTVPGTEKDEEELHGKFAQFRLEGEWFKGEIIEEILTIITTRREKIREVRRVSVSETSSDTLPDMPGGSGTADKDSGVQAILVGSLFAMTNCPFGL